MATDTRSASGGIPHSYSNLSKQLTLIAYGAEYPIYTEAVSSLRHETGFYFEIEKERKPKRLSGSPGVKSMKLHGKIVLRIGEEHVPSFLQAVEERVGEIRKREDELEWQRAGTIFE